MAAEPSGVVPGDAADPAKAAEPSPAKATGLISRGFDRQAKLTAHCPCMCMSIGYLFAFALVVLGAMSSMEPNLPGDGRNVYAVIGWEGTNKHDSMLHAMDSMVIEGVADQQSILSKEFLLINYVASGGNVFSLANLQRMQTLELRVMDYPGYADKCLRERGVCKVNSIVSHLTDDGTVAGTLPSNQELVDARLRQLSEAGQAGFHFDSQFTSFNAQSAMTRAYFFMGLPLAGYRDQNDRAFEQETEQTEWELDMADNVLDQHLEAYKDAGLEFFYIGGNAVLEKHVNERLFADVLFAFGSFVFVWSYMWYHTDSVFLASFGMGMVVWAFPAARGVSMHLFGVLWYDFLNTLLIFLLLGIGADNLFVTLDAFKQSSFSPGLVTETMSEEQALAARLSYTLKRACHAMATTSGTTAAAFLTQVFSGITPTAGFGIYAGCMIIINFFFCAAIFPATIAVHHKYVKKPCACCRCPITYAVERRRGKKEASEAVSADWSIDGYSGQERFFYGSVAPFVVRYRIPVLCFSLLLSVIGIVLMSQITTAQESPSFMPEDDILQTTFNRLQCSSSADHCYVDGQADDISNVVVMVWGIQREPDRQGHSRFEDFTSECENSVCGRHVWDDSFDLRSTDVQRQIAAVCSEGLALRSVGGIDHCIMQDFEEWLGRDASRGSFPVPEADFNAQFSVFIDHEEFSADGNVTRPYRSRYLDTRLVGIDEAGDVRYVLVGWNTPFILGKLYPSDEIEVVYDGFMAFEEATSNRFRAMDRGGDPFVCESKGHELFLIMRMSQEFEAGVWRGLQISLCVAFLMLLVSTGNIVIAVIAIFTIFSVTSATIGSMVVYGWQIGVIESICAVLVVGFSVDYTVHYGISYVERRPEDDGKYGLGSSRGDRVTHAFFELGTSVLGGTATTLGASLFLFACKVQFFKVFGIFMCTVIAWSFVFASILFMPLCALVGPQGIVGDLSRESFRRLLAAVRAR